MCYIINSALIPLQRRKIQTHKGRIHRKTPPPPIRCPELWEAVPDVLNPPLRGFFYDAIKVILERQVASRMAMPDVEGRRHSEDSKENLASQGA
jgi:hypothetical protein